MRTKTAPWLLLAPLLWFAGGLALAGDYAKLAPYDGIRWKKGAPEVRLEAAWYGLVSIDGAPTEDILAFAKRTWPRKWRKRFEEDLVEVLSEMGVPPGEAVTLKLQPLDGGPPITRAGVPMTKANRNAIWQAAIERERHPPLVDPLSARRYTKRAHATKPEPRYLFLQDRIVPNLGRTAEWLSAERARADLDELEWLLEAVYSYLELNDVDHRAALDTIRLGLGDGITRGAFALQVHKLLCLFGDGHTRVRGLTSSILPGPAIELVFRPLGNAIAVLRPRGGLLDSEHPYVLAIDGVPVQKWLSKARNVVAAGSPQLLRWGSARRLAHVRWLRQELGLPEKARATLHLAGRSGLPQREVQVELGVGTPRVRPPALEERREGDVGVLRIREMTDEEDDLATLREAMDGFRDTRGLIIDVRDNGGGSRDILRTLLPYVMAPDEPPHVCNVAAYRLQKQKDRPEGFLENRFLYPVTASVWSAAERDRLRLFARTFQADWPLPEGEFSAWHYMLVSPARQPAPFHYEGRVVILMNEGCYSATDIFLGAFKGRPRVTLLGTKSGGGSGRSRGYRLRQSGLELRLSSMASFRPNGKRYDGVGIAPDVVVTPTLEDLEGTTDSQMAAALTLLTD